MKSMTMALAVIAALGTTACASTGGQAALQPAVANPDAPVQVNVRNNNEKNVDVYALVGGNYQHVVTVPAEETRKVNLPMAANLVDGVRLLVAQRGTSSAFFTDHIAVQPGQTITVLVSNSLGSSSWAVD